MGQMRSLFCCVLFSKKSVFTTEMTILRTNVIVNVHDLRLPYEVSIDIWQYKVEVSNLSILNECECKIYCSI